MPGKGIIDSHIHVWPELSDGSKPQRYTPEDHFALAKTAGVTRTVLIQPGQFGIDNSYMLDAVKAHPGVFSAVAVVDADSETLDATVRQLRAQGVRGFRITARPEKPWTAWEGMNRLWRAAAANRLAVCPLINPDVLPWVASMCERHPAVTVVIDHLSRIGAAGTVSDADVRVLCGLARFRHVHVKVSAFYALGRKAAPYTDLVPLIRQVFETYGPRRLMWGSDAPYQAQAPHTYKASVDLVREYLTFVSREDRQWLLEGTAERVFFS